MLCIVSFMPPCHVIRIIDIYMLGNVITVVACISESIYAASRHRHAWFLNQVIRESLTSLIQHSDHVTEHQWQKYQWLIFKHWKQRVSLSFPPALMRWYIQRQRQCDLCWYFFPYSNHWIYVHAVMGSIHLPPFFTQHAAILVTMFVILFNFFYIVISRQAVIDRGRQYWADVWPFGLGPHSKT